MTYIPGVDSFCKDKPDSAFPVRVLKMHGKDWVEVPHESFPFDVAYMNLYGRYWGNKASEDASGLITWNYKERFDAYPIVGGTQEERLKFIRRPYKLSEFFKRNKTVCGNFR